MYLWTWLRSQKLDFFIGPARSNVDSLKQAELNYQSTSGNSPNDLSEIQKEQSLFTALVTGLLVWVASETFVLRLVPSIS